MFGISRGKRVLAGAAMVASLAWPGAQAALAAGPGTGTGASIAAQTVAYENMSCVEWDMNHILDVIRGTPDWYQRDALNAIQLVRKEPENPYAWAVLAGWVGAPWAYGIAADCWR